MHSCPYGEIYALMAVQELNCFFFLQIGSFFASNTLPRILSFARLVVIKDFPCSFLLTMPKTANKALGIIEARELQGSHCKPLNRVLSRAK